MTQAATKPKLTFAEFIEYDDGTDKRYELVDGVPVEVGAESDRNLRLAMRLAMQLLPFVGIVGLELFRTKSQIQVKPLPGIKHQSREADLIVLSPELADILDTTASSMIEFGMPNPPLVVEFVSPYKNTNEENYQRDYVEKRKQYEQRRVPEFWVVDATASKVTVLTLAANGKYQEQVFGGNEAIASSAFPQLELTPSKLFNA